MKRPFGAVLLGIAAIAAAGCNLILGNDMHDLAHDDASISQGGTSGTGGATSSGSGGSSGGQGGSSGQGGVAAAGQSGSGGQGGNPLDDGSAGRSGSAQGGSAGRDASIGDDGAAGTINRDVSTGSDVQTDAPGPDGIMPDGTMQDSTDDAVDACTPNSKECRGRSVYLCLGGQWVETIQCPYACVTGVCSGLCVPGAMQCTGNTPQTCDITGQWQNGVVCPYVCSQGACTGMCVPGTTVPCGDATTCNAGAVQTCDITGTLGVCAPAPSSCLTIPAGWQAAALTQGTCPSGFGSPQTVYTSATGAPYTCECGCSGTQGCAGTATLEQYAGDAGLCAGVPTSTRSLAFSPTCTSGNYGSIIYNNAYLLSNVDYGPSPACSSNPSPTTQPPVVTQTTNLCTANASCPSGACLSQSQGVNLCVSKQGVQTCPTEYPTATIVSSTYDDTRSCGACTCGSGLICTLNGVVLNNDSSACSTGHAYWMTVTTSCSTAPSSYPDNAVQAASTSMGDPSCVETAPSVPEGDVALDGATTATVCCK